MGPGVDRHRRESPVRRAEMIAVSAKSPASGSIRADSAPPAQSAVGARSERGGDPGCVSYGDRPRSNARLRFSGVPSCGDTADSGGPLRGARRAPGTRERVHVHLCEDGVPSLVCLRKRHQRRRLSENVERLEDEGGCRTRYHGFPSAGAEARRGPDVTPGSEVHAQTEQYRPVAQEPAAFILLAGEVGVVD